MQKLTILANGTRSIEWNGQTGTEQEPEAKKLITDVQALITGQALEAEAAELDMEEKTIKITYSFPNIEEHEQEVFNAFNVKKVDITNSIGLLEAFLNGEIPKDFLEQALELEAQSDEPNPKLQIFLEWLNSQDDT